PDAEPHPAAAVRRRAPGRLRGGRAGGGATGVVAVGRRTVDRRSPRPGPTRISPGTHRERGMSTTAVARSRWRVVVALAAGAVVFLSLGIYGNVHDPTGRSLVTLFFTQTIMITVRLPTAA